jgi:hypothetical protein
MPGRRGSSLLHRTNQEEEAMNRRRAVVFAACLTALALVSPFRAAAHDRAPAPTFAVSLTLPPAPPPWVGAVLPPPAPGPWVQPSPRVYYGWLDANRAAYLARWGWNPWRVARYDAWFRAYRAGLDARFAPAPVAWARPGGNDGRGHGHGNGWGRGHGHGHDD